MFPHTKDNNSEEEKQDDLLMDENLEKEIAVPFEDGEDDEEEDNF